MTDQSIEQEIQAKGLTAPRITPADIEANIASEHYFTAADGWRGRRLERPIAEIVVPLPTGLEPLALLTFCVLVLRNGHRIVGVNEGPVCAENFDAELGRTLARQKAIDQIWPLMGYALRSKLSEAA
jgi:hypothetical protein